MMTGITDRLLSQPGMERCAPMALRRIYLLLFAAGVAAVEISIPVLERMGRVETPERTILRVPRPSCAREYPGFFAYVCAGSFATEDDGGAGRGSDADGVDGSGDGITLIREMSADAFAAAGSRLGPPGSGRAQPACRIVGADDLLLRDYARDFRRMRAAGVDFCPGDDCGCATALAVEWLLAGGGAATVAFLGKGGLAALEEVMLALHIAGGGARGGNPAALTPLKEAYESATGDRVPPRKPVLGERIFHVEAGLHVDGIAKRASNYEPFAPELLGMFRTIRIGKHSGKAAIRLKLKERGLRVEEHRLDMLLDRIRRASVQCGRGLTDDEFEVLAAGSQF